MTIANPLEWTTTETPPTPEPVTRTFRLAVVEMVGTLHWRMDATRFATPDDLARLGYVPATPPESKQYLGAVSMKELRPAIVTVPDPSELDWGIDVIGITKASAPAMIANDALTRLRAAIEKGRPPPCSAVCPFAFEMPPLAPSLTARALPPEPQPDEQRDDEQG